MPAGWALQGRQAQQQVQQHGELALPELHGTLLRHVWLDSNRIAVAFRSGHVIVVMVGRCA